MSKPNFNIDFNAQFRALKKRRWCVCPACGGCAQHVVPAEVELPQGLGFLSVSLCSNETSEFQAEAQVWISTVECILVQTKRKEWNFLGYLLKQSSSAQRLKELHQGNYLLYDSVMSSVLSLSKCRGADYCKASMMNVATREMLNWKARWSVSLRSAITRFGSDPSDFPADGLNGLIPNVLSSVSVTTHRCLAACQLQASLAIDLKILSFVFKDFNRLEAAAPTHPWSCQSAGC